MANAKANAKPKANAKGNQALSEQQRAKLIDMCVDIRAHAENDYEVTLGGNGTNACEASNVVREILSILGVDSKSLQARISERAKELSEEFS
jgi:hypothetical protein